MKYRKPTRDAAAHKRAPGAHLSSVKERRSGRSQEWEFRLYVVDQTPKSKLALANLKRICAERLPAKHRIKVIDLLDKPQLAKRDQILVVPTLIRIMPKPVRTIIGDLSNVESALAGLDLRPGAPMEAM
jgi:circadian clock protein KaiB